MQTNTKRVPRGIRNNNPLNIRIGNNWIGERMEQTDPSFEQFKEMKYGLRAGFIILSNYMKKYGRHTIARIIFAWAPESENNTKAYIKSVCDYVGKKPNDYISFGDEDTMVRLVLAMAHVECGVWLEERQVREAYWMA